MTHAMMNALIYVLLFYLLLSSCIYLFQRRLMYHPVKLVGLPNEYGLVTVEETFIQSADGTKLQLWSHAAQQGFPTIVYFHGNAFHLGDRANKFAGFIKAGFGLVAVSYRGFGKSDGRPSEKGIYADAEAAIRYATDTLKLPQEKLIYFGESLGSGVAVQMAARRTPGLLALEAAYTSVQTRSAELYSYVLGAKYLVRDKYDSLATITRVKAPLLMLHGELDPVIPLRHGKTLFAAANEPKEIVVYPEVHHTDYTEEQTLLPLLAAARKYGLLKS